MLQGVLVWCGSFVRSRWRLLEGIVGESAAEPEAPLAVLAAPDTGCAGRAAGYLEISHL